MASEAPEAAENISDAGGSAPQGPVVDAPASGPEPAPGPVALPGPRRIMPQITPQHAIDTFWKRFCSSSPAKVFTVLPQSQQIPRGATSNGKVKDAAGVGELVSTSYKQAADECVAKVRKIVKECLALNQKYRDPYFNMEKYGMVGEKPFNDCLMGLEDNELDLAPKSVKRIEDIFDDPKFYIEDATANDVRQGNDGDCWFLSALCTVSCLKDQIHRICVAKDEKVGVYGFVFHRDGEWFSEIIDDNLYLTKANFDDLPAEERSEWFTQYRKDPEEEYRKAFQRGSQSLYFAQCNDVNETWLPLLEKAYAKAHGDYAAINGGWSGEAVEDLTGGVTTELWTADIIDKERFWNDELRNVNKDFLFSCGLDNDTYDGKKGLVFNHAYSVMDAVEHTRDGKLYRLAKLRNPWGESEWNGAWSDGSKEWDGYWMETLKHEFGDDGVFWISYQDLLKNFKDFDRTRLFDDKWTVTQQWTSISVPWTLEYLETKFKLEVTTAGPVVIVLSQLDDRYFRGLEGQYRFIPQFRLHRGDEEDYIIRSQANYTMRRSVSAEVNLEPGTYHVLFRIEATRNKDKRPPEKVIPAKCVDRRDKLLNMGRSYDLAHAKGQFKESEAEKRAREKKERKETEKKLFKKAKDRERRYRLKQKVKEKRKQAKEIEKQSRIAAATNAAGTFDGLPPAGPRSASHLSADPDTRSESQISTEADSEVGEDDDELNVRPKVSRLLSKTKYELSVTPKEGNPPQNIAEALQNVTQPAPKNGQESENPGNGPPPAPPMSGDSATAAGRNTTAALGESKSLPLLPSGAPIPPQFLLNDGLPIKRATLDNISDDEISWDSELDYPSSLVDDDTDDDSEAEKTAFQDLPDVLDFLQPPPPPPPPAAARDEQPRVDIVTLLDDPWNAVCVVGLRVFSMAKEGEGVKLEVVKPGETKAEKKVDVDDAAADAIKKLEISAKK
ncbi:MAG: hypothetical protein M1821_003953 [Bathelium mastoideum]|nr:MAG: hypothetical protein M1821_003953 [Bathelium mastoideum]KAI9691027.1 MAG: hypothetical protein M1822_008647 [Bathelium mastoideum]